MKPIEEVLLDNTRFHVALEQEQRLRTLRAWSLLFLAIGGAYFSAIETFLKMYTNKVFEEFFLRYAKSIDPQWVLQILIGVPTITFVVMGVFGLVVFRKNSMKILRTHQINLLEGKIDIWGALPPFGKVLLIVVFLTLIEVAMVSLFLFFVRYVF